MTIVWALLAVVYFIVWCLLRRVEKLEAVNREYREQRLPDRE